MANEPSSSSTIHRLVTIVGPGGVGTTSLAIAAAGDELDRHPDGVWLVVLARLTNPTLLPAELARVLDLRISGRATRDVLVDVLRDRTLLLVLDTAST
ncbi:MAG TPA: hypothetical protein VK923_11925 [Euzebyales bacterium]|nr:hypothetical protein [Euzebyales bacterium]